MDASRPWPFGHQPFHVPQAHRLVHLPFSAAMSYLGTQTCRWTCSPMHSSKLSPLHRDVQAPIGEDCESCMCSRGAARHDSTTSTTARLLHANHAMQVTLAVRLPANNKCTEWCMQSARIRDRTPSVFDSVEDIPSISSNWYVRWMRTQITFFGPRLLNPGEQAQEEKALQS